MQTFDIEKVEWQEISPDGTCYTLLEGDKQDPLGGFSYLLKLPPGAWDRPHWHTGPARLMVLRGVLMLGVVADFKPEKAVPYAPGSILHVPAHEVHFDGCDTETLVFGVAQGPWSTLYVNGDH